MIKNKWMSDLPDDMHISKLSIIGSHNSGTGISLGEYSLTGKLLSPFFRTQHYNISKQLYMGVRYFDLSLKVENDGKLYNYIGDIKLKNSFNIILDIFNEFLISNPSEFILLSIKRGDYGINKNTKISDNDFELLFRKEISHINDKVMFTDKGLNVGESRGKIICANFEHNKHNLQLPMQYGFCDRSRGGNDMDCFKQYLDIVKMDLDSTSWIEDILCMIHCDCKGSFPILEKLPILKDIRYPRRSAMKINRMLKEYYNKSSVKNCILICDFVDDELCDIVINSNFK